MISLSFSLRTVSMSDTAESDGDGVWFISDEDDEPTSNWLSTLIHYFIAPLDRKSWTNLTIIIYQTNYQCSVLLFLSFIHLKQWFSNRVSRHICVSQIFSSVSPKNIIFVKNSKLQGFGNLADQTLSQRFLQKEVSLLTILLVSFCLILTTFSGFHCK
jgi:hypothetical protein